MSRHVAERLQSAGLDDQLRERIFPVLQRDGARNSPHSFRRGLGHQFMKCHTLLSKNPASVTPAGPCWRTHQVLRLIQASVLMRTTSFNTPSRPPKTVNLSIFSVTFSSVSSSFNRNSVGFSSMSRAVLSNDRVAAVSSRRLMRFACATFSA